MATNLGSTLNLCKVFLGAMIEKRCGHIVNISSVAAIKPKAGNSAYGVSKIAIERFSKSLALEEVRFNVHVNCIALGFVKTNMVEHFVESQNKRQFYSQTSMKKVLLPEELVIWYLLFVTKQFQLQETCFMLIMEKILFE